MLILESLNKLADKYSVSYVCELLEKNGYELEIYSFLNDKKIKFNKNLFLLIENNL